MKQDTDGSDNPKILALCGTFGMGGIEKMLLTLLQSGMRFDACADIPDHGELEEEMQKCGCHTYHLTRRSRNFVKHHIELYRIIREGKYSVVWLNSQNAFFMWLHILTARAAGAKRIVVHSHNTKDWRKQDKKILSKWFRHILYQSTDVRLACGKEAALWLFGTDQNVQIIPLPVDTDKLLVTEEKRNFARKSLHLEGVPVYLQTGRFDPVKQQAYTLRVFEKIHKTRKDAVLVFAGDGQEKQKVMEMVEEMGLVPFVRFPGNVKDLSWYYAAADVFFLPSVYEGFPTVLLEAQAAGIPCLVSDTIDHTINKTGLVRFLKADEKQIDAWVVAALSTKGLSEDDRIKANRHIAQEYNAETIALRLEKLFL